ncbi:MAG: LysR family transcriptional regulator [Candidatus Bathyarchaeota archaeon]|nr:LysR family transcriptional regulator [Candidatus Bathyarchaeota archaeon]
MKRREPVEESDEESRVTFKPAYKFWLEVEGSYVFGKGAFELLQKIQEVGTLSGAAEALGMSYRHAWGVIKKIEKRIGKPLLKTRKGGRIGGGGAELTETGRELIKAFSKLRSVFDQAREDELGWEGLSLKISARNRIAGEVVSIEKDRVSAVVKIRVDVPCVVTAFITREAVEDLGINEGDRAVAVVKATEVMVSK